MARLILFVGLCISSQLMLCHTGFLMNPSDYHAIAGTHAEFQCLYFHHTNVSAELTWMFGGVVLNKANNQSCGPKAYTYRGQSEINSTLRITAAMLECNGIVVQCLVYVSLPESFTLLGTDNSMMARLYVQAIPEIEKPSLIVLNNGTLRVMWDSLSSNNTTVSLMDEQVSYDIMIVNGTNQVCHSKDGLNNSMLFYDFNSNLCIGDNECELLTVHLTPIINSEFSGMRAILTTALQPFSLKLQEDAVLVNGSFLFMYTISVQSMQVPLSFCTILLELRNDNEVDSETIYCNKTKTGLGPTNDLRFTVTEADVPYDGRYTTRLYLSNLSTSLMAKEPIKLSTYAIQNVIQQDSQLIIRFVQNTSAQGAFIVCNSSESNELNYNMANRNRFEFENRDTAEIDILPDGNNCSILIYDIKSNGLLSETKNVWPSFVVNETDQPCIMGCESQISDDNFTLSNPIVTVEVTPVDGCIIFVCNISNASLDNELLGCITLVHDHSDYSRLLVNNIYADDLSLNVSVEGGRNYLFAVFELRSSGLLSSNKLKTGMVFVEMKNSDNKHTSTINDNTTTTASDPSSPSNPRIPIIITVTIAAALVTLSVIIIIIIIIIAWQKLQTKSMKKKHDPDGREQTTKM